MSVKIVVCEMDIPGLSLFQGAESIKLNNDEQRIEEEDAAEDRLRRNEEVSNGKFVRSTKCQNFSLNPKFCLASNILVEKRARKCI